MSGNSSVGNSQVYEAKDQVCFPIRDCTYSLSLTNYSQRTSKDSENNADRFHEGKEHSHKANDSSKDIHQQHDLNGS